MPKASSKKMNRNDPAPVQVASSETSGIQPKAEGARLSRPRSAKSRGKNKKKPDPEEKATYTNTMVNDVIDGRGVRTASSSGNVRFRRLVKLFVIKNYCEVIKLNEKKNIAKGIINYIHSLSPPGRFLKSVGLQNYVELDEKECVKKVTQALRDCNRSDRTGYAVRVDVPEDVKILEEKVKKLKSRGRKKLEKVVELLGGHLETMKTQRAVASFTQAQGDEGSSSSNSPDSIPSCKASYPQMQSLQSNQTNLPLSHGGYARTSENKRKRDDFESFTYHRQLPYPYHPASPYSRMNYLHPSAPGHHISELARAPAFHAFHGYGPSPRYAYAGPEQHHSPLRTNSTHKDLHLYRHGNQMDSCAQGDDNMDLKYRTKTTAMRKPSTPRSFSQKYEFHPIEHPATASSLEALDGIPLYHPSNSTESRVHEEGKESLQQHQFHDTIQPSLSSYSFGDNITQKSTDFPFDDNEAILGPINIPQPLKKSSTNETDLSTEVATATSRSSPFTPVAIDQNQNTDLQLPTTDSFLEDAFNMDNSRINAGLPDDLLPAEALEISNTEDILGGTDDGLFYFSAQEGENFGKE